MAPGGPLVKLGNVTGWLGWQTVSLDANHTSKLGYPCNLDGCQKMQNITSTSFRTSAPNNVEYGSDARGGSSGGPWVQNFATVPAGGGTGTNPGLNRVVGITSYGYINEDPKDALLREYQEEINRLKTMMANGGTMPAANSIVP